VRSILVTPKHKGVLVEALLAGADETPSTDA
jgi:hypothetical protein